MDTKGRNISSAKKIIFQSTAILIFALQIYAFFAYRAAERMELPGNIGNFEHVRSLLDGAPESGDFSFAVVGDTRSIGTHFDIASGLAEEDLAFAVMLGDFSHVPTQSFHNYFKTEARKLAYPYPVFLIAGNHEVKHGKFTLEQFESAYGPGNFVFTHRGVLFVVVTFLRKPATNVETLEFLRTTLAENAGTHDRIIVLTHISPKVSDHFKAKSYKGSDELAALLEKYRVDYLIAGDWHGYARVQRKETTFLITGGGGAYLHPKKFGRFHHAIVIEVLEDGYSERILQVDSRFSFGLGLRAIAIGYVYPVLFRYPVFVLLMNLLLVAGVVRTLRRRR